MMPRRTEPAALASVLPPGGLTPMPPCSAGSALLADTAARAGDAPGALTFSGAASRVPTSYQAPELKADKHGAADLRGLGRDARAAALTAIAAPGHRKTLARGRHGLAAGF